MTYLLDTCIISDLVSLVPDSNLITWINSQPEEMMFISVTTLAEIKRTIESVESPKLREQMNQWLKNDLMVRFADRISEITASATLKWGELSAKVHSQGHRISSLDSLNLAIALIYNHTLVTRNTKVFEGTGVNLLDPYAKKI